MSNRLYTDEEARSMIRVAVVEVYRRTQARCYKNAWTEGYIAGTKARRADAKRSLWMRLRSLAFRAAKKSKGRSE